MKKLQRFLEEHAEGMKSCFHLEHFDIYLRYKPKLDCQMEIDIDYRYLEAEICYGKIIKNRWSEDNVEAILKTLTHEMTHVMTGMLVQPFRNKYAVDKNVFVHFDEQVTEHVSRLLFQLYMKRIKL